MKNRKIDLIFKKTDRSIGVFALLCLCSACLVSCNSGGSDDNVDTGTETGLNTDTDTASDTHTGTDTGTSSDIDINTDTSSDSGTDAPGNNLSSTDLKIAVIPIMFSDQNEPDLPTQAEITAKLGSSTMEQLFQDNSNGNATYNVEVAPWQNVSATQMEIIGDDLTVDDIELAPVNVSLPQFSGDTHYLVYFAAFDTVVTGGLPGSWTFMDYGDITDPRASLNGELVPHMMFLTTAQDTFDEVRSYGFAAFDPRTETHDWYAGEVTGESRPIDQLQVTFAHEMVHYLGFGPHANSWDKGERYFFEPADVDDELREEYGNHFALLGISSSLTPVMHSVYRHAVGWAQGQSEELAADEDRRVIIAPINRTQGTTIVRFVTDAATGDGIYLELREDDGWHDFMKNTPLLAGNLDGIMVLAREGDLVQFTSYLVDASPMPRAKEIFSGQDLTSLNDAVLKPGMEFHMPQMSLTEVQTEADAHLSVRIQTFSNPREILYRPVRPSFTRVGDTATVTWAGSTHGDTTGFEVEVIATDETVVTTTVDGAGETSAILDIFSLSGKGELHARVRAVGGGRPANWSRDAYIVTSP